MLLVHVGRGRRAKAYDDVTYAYDDVTYAYDDVTCAYASSYTLVGGVGPKPVHMSHHIHIYMFGRRAKA